MKKPRKKILMACSNYWSSPFQVGSHQLARGFVNAGWDVAFITDPVSPFHLIGGYAPELKERYSYYKAGGVNDLEGHLWAYVPGAVLTPHNKPLLKSDWVLKNWPRLTFPNVVSKVVQQGFGEVDLLYLDSISQAFWLKSIKYKKSVFRVADKNKGFAKYTPAMEKAERVLARSVHVVAYTARNLKQYVLEMSPRETLYLPNGVNYPHFENACTELPTEYKSISGSIAVYVGAMDYWFDFELIYETALKLPGVSFVLIGPEALARKRLRPLANIHLLGQRSYSRIPQYLYNADVGIIPFNVKNYPDLVNSINPLKLYEYMACGLPVVAAAWDELKTLGSPALLYDSPGRFASGIEAGIRQKGDQEKFIEYAKKADWEQRISQLTDFVGL